MPVISIFMLALLFSPLGRVCSCKEAVEADLPHGANEILEYRPRTVRDLRGTILFPDHSLAGDVVVELYDLPDKKAPAYGLVREKPRRTACITSADGSFCFPNLPSGNYLLRAGTRTPQGMNEAYIKITVDRRWFTGWFRQSKPIDLTLTLGT